MRIFSTLFLGLSLLALPAAAEGVRIKDVVTVEGVRDNQLVGYGLVVGLNGSGDSLTNSGFTEQSLIGMLERLGVNARGQSLKTKNVAAVMVTATLPPFARPGSRTDVSIATLGDAKNITGGQLLVTPLLGADGQVYAVAQGSIATFLPEGRNGGGNTYKGVPTSGRISGGGLVEKSVDFQLASLSVIRLALRNPDFTTANRIAAAINGKLGAGNASATDPGTVTLPVPAAWRGDIVGLMSQVESLTVEVDQTARVVIDEASGIIIMGRNVRITPVAIAQGNLSIRVGDDPAPPPPANNRGAPPGDHMTVLPSSITLQALVGNLNALGLSPREMIQILQALKAEGALQAEIEAM